MGEYEFEDEEKERKFQQEEDHTHNDSSPQPPPPPPPPPVDEEDLIDSKSNVFFLIHRSFIFQFQSIRVFRLFPNWNSIITAN